MTASSTEVHVSRRVLWIGSDAYPLQNTARAQVRTLLPKPGTPVKNFMKNLAGSAAAGMLAIIALPVVGVHNSPDYALIVALTLAALSVYGLVRAIQRERRKLPYHMLVIETAGTPRTLLASTNRQQIGELVEAIMAAIDDATVTYHNLISNHYGDIIRQYGNENIAKMMA